MGTAAGFFGITYQGAVNGLASVTLSIFNMVRRLPARGSQLPSAAAAAALGEGWRRRAAPPRSPGARARAAFGRTTPMTARG